MKVRDLLIKAAENVGAKYELGYLCNGRDISRCPEIMSMHQMFKSTCDELFSNYIKFRKTISLEFENKKYPLKLFDGPVYYISWVKRGEEDVLFKIEKRALIVPKKGIYSVCYRTAPCVGSIEDEIPNEMRGLEQVIISNISALMMLVQGNVLAFKRFYNEYKTYLETLKIKTKKKLI